MIICQGEFRDWTSIRQALSLSLLSMKPVTIAGACTFLDSNPQYGPVFHDLALLAESAGAGVLSIRQGSIVYEPRRPHSFEINFESGKYSSISEMLLFLAPSLFLGDFRTLLNLRGVTNPQSHHPLSLLNESLFSFLEQGGFYGGIVLKRYGFSGSGGGIAEARIYPRHKGRGEIMTRWSGMMPRRARIIFSGPFMGLAEKMKDMISRDMGLGSGDLSIIEVLDSDGMGLTALLYLEAQGEGAPVPCILSSGARVYNHCGDLVLDEEECLESLGERIEYALRCAAEKMIPEPLFREIALYYHITGVRDVEGPQGELYRRLAGEWQVFGG